MQRTAVGRILVPFLPAAERPPHQPVNPERFLLEKYTLVQIPTGVKILIESAVESPHIDAEILEQIPCDSIPLVRRAVDGLGAAVAQQGLSVDDEFVAFCVTAEIVVGIQDQDPGCRAPLPVEVRGGQAADAGAYHDQVVVLGHRCLDLCRTALRRAADAPIRMSRHGCRASRSSRAGTSAPPRHRQPGASAARAPQRSMPRRRRPQLRCHS